MVKGRLQFHICFPLLKKQSDEVILFVQFISVCFESWFKINFYRLKGGCCVVEMKISSFADHYFALNFSLKSTPDGIDPFFFLKCFRWQLKVRNY